MDILNTSLLQSFIKNKKRKSEELLPGLVKRLIKNSNSSVDGLRIPQGDDISIPGFDGIVHAEKGTLYVEEGTSVWEFGTSSDAQRKIKDDCLKRTVNSLGVKKSEVTLCLVTTQILANKKTSITELENKYKKTGKKFAFMMQLC